MYAVEHWTDGFVPKAAIPTLGIWSDAAALTQRLLDAKLLEDHGDLVKVHDFEKYNISAKEARSLAAKRAKAGKISAARRVQHMPNTCSTPVPTPVEQVFNTPSVSVSVSGSGSGSEPVDRAPEDPIPLQGRIKGKWMHEMQTQKRDPNPRPPDRHLESAVAWAVGRPWEDVERAIVALVADDDKWVRDNSWGLWLLERKGAAYLAAAKPQRDTRPIVSLEGWY
jgi:hypothetical protein